MALQGNTPARVKSTRLLRAEVLIDWSTLPSVLRPWFGRSSQAVERAMCAGKKDPSRRRVNLPMSARPLLEPVGSELRVPPHYVGGARNAFFLLRASAPSVPHPRTLARIYTRTLRVARIHTYTRTHAHPQARTP